MNRHYLFDMCSATILFDVNNCLGRQSRGLRMGSTRYRLVPSATNRESVHAQFVARYALPHAPGPALQDFAGGVADSDRHAAADGGGADQPLNARVGSPDIPHE